MNIKKSKTIGSVCLHIKSYFPKFYLTLYCSNTTALKHFPKKVCQFHVCTQLRRYCYGNTQSGRRLRRRLGLRLQRHQLHSTSCITIQHQFTWRERESEWVSKYSITSVCSILRPKALLTAASASSFVLSHSTTVHYMHTSEYTFGVWVCVSVKAK